MKKSYLVKSKSNNFSIKMLLKSKTINTTVNEIISRYLITKICLQADVITSYAYRKQK